MTTQIAQITNPVLEGSIGSGDGNQALAITMANLLQTLTMIGGLALLLYLAWGGINWLTAGGDSEKVTKAKDRITQAIVGMAILVGLVAIANFLSFLYGFDLLNPEVPTPGGS